MIDSLARYIATFNNSLVLCSTIRWSALKERKKNAELREFWGLEAVISGIRRVDYDDVGMLNVKMTLIEKHCNNNGDR